MRRVHRWTVRLGCLACGAMPAFAFPRPDLAWLAWVGLVPALLVVRAAPDRPAAGWRAWWVGLGFLTTVAYWLAPSLLYAGLALAAGALALLWVPWGWFVRATLGRPLSLARGSAALVLVPTGWVAQEAVRSWDRLGGPWALLGVTQWHHPVELGLASVGGAWLVSAAIVAANVGVVLLLDAGWVAVGRRRAASPTVASAAGGLGVLGAAGLVVSVLAGPLVYAATPPARVPSGSASTVRVALVQPGALPPGPGTLRREVALTAGLATQHPGLVVWGESSIGDDVAHHASQLAVVRGLASRVGADLLINDDGRAPSGRIEKTSLLVGPGGVLASYVKNRLVPFGEYVPFPQLFGWLRDFTRAAPRNVVAGHGLVVMHAGALRIGPLICFESAFPDMARTLADQGVELITYQTSDSTWPGTWVQAQHASMAAVRAAEVGRPAVQSALTGDSVVADSRGRLLGWAGQSTSGVLLVDVPLAGWTTVYDRIGDVVPVGAVVLTLVAVAGLVVTRRRDHGSPAAPARRPRSGRGPGRVVPGGGRRAPLGWSAAGSPDPAELPRPPGGPMPAKRSRPDP
ncbi:MAG: apolipoprotein N-acyltransferase [Actinomycetes bacterium]